MNTVQQRKKIHPYKFTLWVGIGSIVMMFAGLTSAYIVKRSQANWAMLEIPKYFWFSTITILVSSVTLIFAARFFKERDMQRYRMMLWITAVLGAIFMVLQILGFASFSSQDIRLVGAGSNASYSFLLAIASLHALHVLGGVIALIIITLKTLSKTERNYSSVPIEVMATYWHFVDLLWIYLFVFFMMMR